MTVHFLLSSLCPPSFHCYPSSSFSLFFGLSKEMCSKWTQLTGPRTHGPTDGHTLMEFVLSTKNDSDNLSFAVWKMFAYCSYQVPIIQFQCLFNEYCCSWLMFFVMMLKIQHSHLTVLCQSEFGLNFTFCRLYQMFHLIHGYFLNNSKFTLLIRPNSKQGLDFLAVLPT